jgi:hypothetical protein
MLVQSILDYIPDIIPEFIGIPDIGHTKQKPKEIKLWITCKRLWIIRSQYWYDRDNDKLVNIKSYLTGRLTPNNFPGVVYFDVPPNVCFDKLVMDILWLIRSEETLSFMICDTYLLMKLLYDMKERFGNIKITPYLKQSYDYYNLSVYCQVILDFDLQKQYLI